MRRRGWLLRPGGGRGGGRTDMEILWPLGLTFVLGMAYNVGGMVLFVVVGVALTVVFKALGDTASKR